jgi:hypothetical protein
MGRLHVPALKHDPQGYGSALTYARRYSLMAACGIAAEDDDGNAGSKKPIPKPESKPVNPLDAVVQKVTAESAESAPKQIEYQDESGGSWALRLPNRSEPMSISFNQESWLHEFNTMADSVMKSGKLPPLERIEKLKQLRQANEAEVSRLVMMDKAKFLQTYSQRIGALDALAKAAA